MKGPHLDTSLKLLSDSRRREIIRRLRRQSPEETPVADLVDQLLESGSVPSANESPDRKHILIQLTHNHLPRLDDHGVIDYDRENETVRYTSRESIEAVLDALSEESGQPTPDLLE